MAAAQGTRRCAFTVLFRAAGVGGCAAVSAVVGHSTSALRALLREEGVGFSMPLAPHLREDPLAAVALAEVKACNAGKVTVDHGCSPCLSIPGVLGSSVVGDQ